MLDEIREYKEYTWDLDGDKFAERIKYGTLSKGKGFSGLERMLTIIARHFLYEEDDKVEQADIDAAYAAIRSWFSITNKDYKKKLNDERIKEIDAICCWAQKYISNVLIEEVKKDKDKKKTLEKKLDWIKSEDFRSRLVKSNFENGLPNKRKNSDEKEITIDRVVANAICRKKLRKFYLCCEGACFENVKILKDEKVNLGIIDIMPVPHELNEKQKDTLLRLVAVYLLENFYIDGCEIKETVRLVPFNKMAFSNWYMGAKYFDWTDARYVCDEEYLIKRHKRNRSNSGNKIGFNEAWFKKYGWTLIDATDGDEELDEYLKGHPNAHFYRDDGASKALVEGARYE